MSEEFDPTYTPSSELLGELGITATKTDKGWFDKIRSNHAKSIKMEIENAVAAFTLFMRGHTHEGIAAEVQVDTRTVKRWCVQGKAILRTLPAGEDAASRALSATRLGDVSMAVVDAATMTDDSDADKLATLETLALSNHIKKSFVKEDESALSDEEVSDIVTSLPEQAQANLGIDKAPTAKQMFDAVPNVAEAFAIQRKVTTRKTAGGNGDGAPQQPQVHLKAALADVRQIVKDNDGATYVPTADDLKALLALVQYLLPESGLDADIKAAIDAVVGW